ncbi:MAG: hypothetical protein MI922_17135, partial [Bacteroidales bacterium]|nr:hypothetical protein [Bacteroidales bacterium]
MKVLYAIQGTGNGHLSRSRDIIPILQKYCDLDLLISGYQANVELPWEVKFRLRGLSFIFGKRGGVDILKTLIKAQPLKLIREINTLPVKDYDLVINDFEPVSAWACRRRKIPCVGLSHQSAVLNKKAPQPSNKDLVGYLVLKKYAPVNKAFGFHFKAYDDHIFTPVIRPGIRNAQTKKLAHYTVYLPAYSDNHLIEILGK